MYVQEDTCPCIIIMDSKMPMYTPIIVRKTGTNTPVSMFRRNKFAGRNKSAVTPDNKKTAEIAVSGSPISPVAETSK